ncbi:bifunctional acetate--CoA ligase family protein/GNAT family N-acetyltransferase [Maritimibacter sp. DP1N21-5]|uniref:bifunctional acetate--CoA ligase family protein/GNAT family N-acetyltransferase n=1 Tax=Maritimibacter sp. DP1N21-5 TaxID=2836867 RepID=UPI001C4772A9|nr:bifunctional acetate--CoA ligase family protein/GNAT family N-acetyltransferase [Maritimibacter sp. DP1N21-5]MBV7407521.1 bifunctional acetate--CoA ligase family protein/GNAT family N-acetyltransferase [Maritimibacter sp. DP1N21-5]
MDESPLKGLMDPDTIAVFGASNNDGSVGALVLRNLVSGGYEGGIFPVHPTSETLAGLPCHRTLSEIDTEVDLAVIATPAAQVPGIIRDCGEAGIRNAIVLSPGFGEGESADAGKRYEDDLRETAKRAGVRFMGPNCVGLVRPWAKMNASFLRVATPKGRLALISQSGALCSAISDWAGPHHLGFSALASLGNSTDIDFGEMLQYLASDPHTDAILLYVEGVRNAPGFISALRYAARLKPVIVLKSGRHAGSAEASHTHTGALIGSDAVFDAVMERTGAVRAMTFGQLFAAAEILSSTKKATGNRLAIIANGGGAGVLAADRAADLSVDLARIAPETRAAMAGALPAYAAQGNPVDILGDAGPEAFAAAVKATYADPDTDGLLVMLTPQAMTDPTAVAQAVVDALPKRRTKPVLACWMGEAVVAEGRRVLSSNGVADFISPERAVEAFSYLARHHRNRKLALENLRPMSPENAPDLEGARMIIEAALAEDREMLTDIESKALLKAFRIPINLTVECETPAEAIVAAQTVGYPVAMKILSPDVTHKSDVGGVRVGIGDPTEVKRAFRDITERLRRMRPDARIKGVTVEAVSTIEAARELVIGASRDPVFGPTILFGAGGTAVEVLNDSAVALPPLNAVLAERLIDKTRVARLLEAFRDMPAADRRGVVNVLRRVSAMVSELPEIVELDINPLLAGPNGVMAVDARVRVARPPAMDGQYDHMAIHPYPRHLVEVDHLSDGTPLVIRPIRPEDAKSEQDFVKALSKESRMFRFMGVLNELSPEMLVQFTQIDYRREMALVAMAEIDGREVQCGVARYVINPDNRSAEFAIVVGDQVKKQGIGTRLMKALFRAARDHDLSVIEGTVLRNNAPMLELMRDLGFSVRGDPEDRDIVIVERRL